jgi:gamma-glutamylcyclotransferase (GGCT)/AIG2-like uncharacterized protein YtfP
MLTVDNLEDTHLTELEKTLIRTYEPEKSLIVYGTLAPIRSNHFVIEHIKGNWQHAIIRGKLENMGWGAGSGYYGFKFVNTEEQQEINAFVLSSDELIANWHMLDEFEGDEYKRVLAKYELQNGEVGIGYIYAINAKHINEQS